MRKLLGKCKRSLSLLLVAAMLMGTVPENILMASAMESVGETPMEEVTLLQEEGASLDNEPSEEAGEIKEALEEDLVPESQNPSETEGDPETEGEAAPGETQPEGEDTSDSENQLPGTEGQFQETEDTSELEEQMPEGEIQPESEEQLPEGENTSESELLPEGDPETEAGDGESELDGTIPEEGLKEEDLPEEILPEEELQEEELLEEELLEEKQQILGEVEVLSEVVTSSRDIPVTVNFDSSKFSYSLTAFTEENQKGEVLKPESTQSGSDIYTIKSGTTAVMLRVDSKDSDYASEVKLNSETLSRTSGNNQIREYLLNGERLNSLMDGMNQITIEGRSLVVGRIQFTNTAAHGTYTVTETANVKKEAGRQTMYKLYGEESVMLKVTMAGKYQPKVTLGSTELTWKEDQVKATKTGAEYLYEIPYTILQTSGNIVKIEETIEEKTVTVTIDDPEIVSLWVSADGKLLAAENPDPADGKYVYKVPYGTVITLNPKIEHDLYLYEFTGATTKVGEAAAKQEKIKPADFTYSITVTDHVEAEITTRGIDHILFSEDGNVPIEAVKNTYNIVSEKEYQIEVYNGVERAEITAFKLSGGKSTGSIYTESGTEEESGALAKFTVDFDDAGKKLKAEITAGGKNYTLNFSVSSELKEIKINGKKESTVSLPVRSYVEYPVVLNPATAMRDWGNEAEIFVDSDNDQRADSKVVSAYVTQEGKLGIEVITEFPDREAVVEIRYKGESYGKVTVKTIAPSWTTQKPTVKMTDSDAHSFTLSMSMAGVIPLNEYEFYYKVNVSEIYVEDGKTKYRDPVNYYVPYSNTISASGIKPVKITTINVNDNHYGSNTGAKYKVEVELFQMIPGKTLTQEAHERYKLFRSNKMELTNISIKPYYFEDKLTVKKGTTTVYTGQQNVVIGTAVFGKNTTAKGINSVSLTKGVNGDSNVSKRPIEFISDRAGNIYANVKADAPIGKGYVATVTARAEDFTQAAIAEITLEVVRAIEAIDIEFPSILYKPVNKAVNFKAQVVYNDGNVNEQPKTKKVTWGIYDNEYGEGETLNYQGLTVKNGQVTIPKDYILNGRDTYYLVAKAADYKDNPVVGSVQFTITNQPVQMGEAVLVRENGGTYDVVARSGGILKGTDLLAGDIQLTALKKGVDEKDSYFEYEIITPVDGSFNYSSSNKALSVDREGYLSVGKTGKNIKLTMTAADGSNTKAVLDKLTIDYDNGKDIGLEIYRISDPAYDVTSSVGTKNDYATDPKEVTPIEFRAAKDSVFRIQVIDMTNESEARFINHKLNVTGAKVLGSNPEDGSYTILATGEKILLTLTDKSVTPNTKKIYGLKNTYLKTDAAPEVATTDKPMGYQEAIDVTYDVTFSKKATYSAVYVTLDQSKLYSRDPGYLYLHLAGTGQESCLGSPLEIKDGKIELKFSTEDKLEGSYIYPGSYQLNFVFGDFDTESGDFVAKTKPVTSTLKIDKPSPIKPAKLNASYNMNIKETSQVELTLTNKKHRIIEVGDLRSINVKGKSNGFINVFESRKTVFDGERVMYINASNKIDLKESWDHIPKTKFEGYVSYVVCEDENGRQYMISNSKISITMKDSKPVYKAEPIELVPGIDIGEELKFKKVIGKEEVEVKIASIHINHPDFYINGSVEDNGTVELLLKANHGLTTGSIYHLEIWITEKGSGVVGANPETYQTVGTKVRVPIMVGTP